MNIYVIGPPGSGKSTLTKAIKANLGCKAIHSGAIVRDLADGDPEIRAALHRGEMAPPKKVDSLFIKKAKAGDLLDDVVLFDGYPRYMAQLLDVMTVMTCNHAPFFIWVHTNRQTCIDRMEERGRDSSDARDRYATYERETLPVWDWLSTRMPQVVYSVSGTAPLATLIDECTIAIKDQRT